MVGVVVIVIACVDVVDVSVVCSIGVVVGIVVGVAGYAATIGVCGIAVVCCDIVGVADGVYFVDCFTCCLCHWRCRCRCYSCIWC